MAMDVSTTSTAEAYAYVHILPKRTGERYIREIVPVKSVKKFDFQEYKCKENVRRASKKTHFFIRHGPGGEKRKCLVLFASG